MFTIDILTAFAATLFAGLCTGIGSIIAYASGKKALNGRYLSACLALSAGVMIYVSLFEILNKSYSAFLLDFSPQSAMLYAVISFFGAIILVWFAEKLIPDGLSGDAMTKTGLVTAGAIALHNIPEGFATFVSSLDGTSAALTVAFAIAIHNIPEGIAVFVPVYYGTKSAKKAFFYSFLSGLTEPLGALIGYGVMCLLPAATSIGLIQGIVFAFAAGVMTFISFDEMLPNAYRHNDILTRILIFSGMAVMALSLLLFK